MKLSNFQVITRNSEFSHFNFSVIDRDTIRKLNDGKKYPAVGISFGLDVIFEILKEKEKNKKTSIDIYIIPMQNKIQALKIAETLRKQNINVDIEMNERKMKKSLNYANTERIPYVIILGDEELSKGKVILKDMKNGKQKEIEIEKIGGIKIEGNQVFDI